MMEGDAYSRLLRWVRQQAEDAQAFVLSGQCAPDDYKAACQRFIAFNETIAQARLIASGKDLVEKHVPSPLRDIE